MSAHVAIRCADDGYAVHVERYLPLPKVELDCVVETIATLPAPFDPDAVAVARRVQQKTGTSAWLVLGALARAYRSEHFEARAA